jgi:hypothetical protein
MAASPTSILSTSAPNLPLATQEYDPNYTNQILNVQRLYYIQNDFVYQQTAVNASSSLTVSWLGGF